MVHGSGSAGASGSRRADRQTLPAPPDQTTDDSVIRPQNTAQAARTQDIANVLRFLGPDIPPEMKKFLERSRQ
jgi:hypothetical protein